MTLPVRPTAGRVCAVALMAAALSCDDARAAGSVSRPGEAEAVEQWMRDNAIPLRSTEASAGLDDLEAVSRVIGSARVVALGEATHGTHEFFTLKHRLAELLVTRLGFTIFALETNMPEAARLNEYVLGGPGDPRALLEEMYFWTWETEEMLALVEWMRTLNQSGRGHVEFAGFDMQNPDLAMRNVREFVNARAPSLIPLVDDTWARIDRMRPDRAFGVATARLPVSSQTGRVVTLAGFIKTSSIWTGVASLWIRADGPAAFNGRPSVLAFDGLGARAPAGTTPWTRYQVSIRVPRGATSLSFGVMHTGDGTAWFDDLRLRTAGKDIGAPGVDLAFESNDVRGFERKGPNHRIAIDLAVAHGGRRSLRSSYEGGPLPGPESWRALGQPCRRIVDEVRALPSNDQDSRERAWITQNANLVRQFVDLQAGTPTRDESMAENVEWIARQHASGKIILSAHNAHVAYSGSSLVPMSYFLREALGSAVVNLGFAFDRGSFRAIGPSHSIEVFTAQAAREGSLDHALARVGVPSFVLDLRAVPESGPVHEWFVAPHDTKSIGAVYSNAAAQRYLRPARVREMFDALVFVDQTTASREIVFPRP